MGVSVPVIVIIYVGNVKFALVDLGICWDTLQYPVKVLKHDTVWATPKSLGTGKKRYPSRLKIIMTISYVIFQVYLKDPRPASASTEHLDTWAAMDPGHVSELWNRGNVARLPLSLIFLGMPTSLDNQLILRWYPRIMSQWVLRAVHKPYQLTRSKRNIQLKCTTCFAM